MRKKQIVCLTLAAALLGLTACGNTQSAGTAASTEKAKTEGTEGTKSTETTEAGKDGDSSEPVTLTYWVPFGSSAAKYVTGDNDNVAYQEAMKRLGINIEFIHPAIGQEQEEFNLLFLGDKLPDIIAYADRYAGGEFQGMRDGVFKDLTELVPQYAPDYYKVLTENEEFYRESTDNNGHIVSFNNCKPVADPPFRRWVFKKDLLSELDCDIPKTVADYEAMFEKIKAKGMTPYLLDKFGYEVQLEGLFDVYYNKDNNFFQKDGVVKCAPLEDGFKDYLTLINKWYSSGYISKDFSSIKDAEANTLFDTDQIGTYLAPTVATFNRGERQGFEVVSAPYIRLEEGQQLHWEDYNVWPRTREHESTVVISKDCQNVEAAMKFLNYGYTGEGANLYNWGVEGVNWNWQGDKRVYNDTMLNNPKFGTEEASFIYKVHFAPKINYPDVECHANLLKSEGALAIRMKWSDDDKIDSSLQLPPYQLEEDEQQRLGEIMTPVNTYIDEMTLKFITGAEPLDNFDNFRATIKSMGIDEALQLKQDGLDAYMAKEVK